MTGNWRNPGICSIMVPLLMLLLVVCGGASAQQLNNVIIQWQNLTQDAVRTFGIPNQISARYYGLVGLAQYNAVSDAKKKTGNVDAAAAYAGHAVLSALFPWKQVSTYDATLKKQVANLSESVLNVAESAGVGAAVQLLQATAGDEATRFSRFQPAPPNTPFQYQFTPNQTYALYPQLASEKPLVWTTSALDKLAYNNNSAQGPVFKPPRDDYNETFVYGVKNSPVRAQYDTGSVYFWADGSTTSAIGGHWASIAFKVLPATYTTEQTALFFARFGASLYDASIACWKVKYSVLHWRPITAFREGYPGFAAVPDWTPELTTPPHPEYPSGHQCTVGAALETLVQALGTDQVTFTIGTEGNATLAPRTHTSLTAAAVEVGDSRLFAGLHFNSSNVDGLKLGRLVGKGVYESLK